MTTLTLQQAYDACQTNKTAWLNRKTELAAAVACQKIPVNPVIFPEISHASIRCMVLHANPRILFPPPRQYRRGLSRFMHLH